MRKTWLLSAGILGMIGITAMPALAWYPERVQEVRREVIVSPALPIVQVGPVVVSVGQPVRRERVVVVRKRHRHHPKKVIIIREGECRHEREEAPRTWY